MNEFDDVDADDWPNDDEANDIMLAYAATDDGRTTGSGSGCAGVILTLIVIVISMLAISI